MLAQVFGPASKTYIYIYIRFQSFFMKIRVSFAGPYQDLMTEAPKRPKSSHFGVILEASKRLPGGLQEAPRRLLGGSQKGPRCPDAAPEGPHVRPWLGETPRGCSGCGSALSVGVLALLALLALAFEPNQCQNLSSVSLSQASPSAGPGKSLSHSCCA